MSELFHPETFLNALRQKSARQLKIAIDELKLVSSFEPKKIPPATAIQLEGLWLQGCDFDGKRMADIIDSQGGFQSELISLPKCHVGWIGDSEPEPYESGSTVSTPIYHTLDREKLLCQLFIPNNGDASVRIIGGTALFLSGDA